MDLYLVKPGDNDDGVDDADYLVACQTRSHDYHDADSLCCLQAELGAENNV